MCDHHNNNSSLSGGTEKAILSRSYFLSESSGYYFNTLDQSRYDGFTSKSDDVVAMNICYCVMKLISKYSYLPVFGSVEVNIVSDRESAIAEQLGKMRKILLEAEGVFGVEGFITDSDNSIKKYEEHFYEDEETEGNRKLGSESDCGAYSSSDRSPTRDSPSADQYDDRRTCSIVVTFPTLTDLEELPGSDELAKDQKKTSKNIKTSAPRRKYSIQWPSEDFVSVCADYLGLSNQKSVTVYPSLFHGMRGYSPLVGSTVRSECEVSPMIGVNYDLSLCLEARFGSLVKVSYMNKYPDLKGLCNIMRSQMMTWKSGEGLCLVCSLLESYNSGTLGKYFQD